MKNKTPTRRYPCDELKLTIAGETYFPHAGEWVEMRGGPSWDFMRDAAALTRLESRQFNALSDTDSLAMVNALDRLIAFLSTRIIAWNWTDPDGQPLPAPSPEVLGALERDEVIWLITTLIGGATPAVSAEDEKNA